MKEIIDPQMYGLIDEWMDGAGTAVWIQEYEVLSRRFRRGWIKVLDRALELRK